MRLSIATITVLSGFLLSSTLAQNDGGVVTLFGPKPPTPTTTDSEWIEGATTLGVEAISTDAEGYTYYAASYFQTIGVMDGLTYLSTPTFTTFTFRADASRYHAVGPLRAIEPTGTVGGGFGVIEYEEVKAITECEGDIDGSSDDTDMIACSMRLEFTVTPTPTGGPTSDATGTPTPSVRTREMWTISGEKDPLYTIAALGDGVDADEDDSGAVSALKFGGAVVWLGIIAGGMAVWFH